MFDRCPGACPGEGVSTVFIHHPVKNSLGTLMGINAGHISRFGGDDDAGNLHLLSLAIGQVFTTHEIRMDRPKLCRSSVLRNGLDKSSSISSPLHCATNHLQPHGLHHYRLRWINFTQHSKHQPKSFEYHC